MFTKFDSKGSSCPERAKKNSQSLDAKHATTFAACISLSNTPLASLIPMRSILNESSELHNKAQFEELVVLDPPRTFSSKQKPHKLDALTVLHASTESAGQPHRPRSAGRSAHKSKTGCLTCKFRKKKCDETRPVCRDCHRFHKECVWADHRTMNGAEIDRLKAHVRAKESSRKMRKRVRLPPIDMSLLGAVPLPSTSPEGLLDQSGCLASRKGPIHRRSRSQGSRVGQGVPSATLVPSGTLISSSLDMMSAMAQPQDPEFSMGTEPLDTFKSQDTLPVDLGQTALSPHLFAVLSGLEASNVAFPLASELVPAKNTEPVENVYDLLQPFEHLAQPRSSAAILGFLKELSAFNLTANEFSGGYVEDAETAGMSDVEMPRLGLRSLCAQASPNFNIPAFIEQMQAVSHNRPAQFNNLASSFNAAFSPSPRASVSFSPELDQQGLHLYNYYLEVLSQKISIAPCSQNESNSFQRVFLPLAQKDKGVLYGLLAWAGFHLGGKWLKEGTRYAKLALQHLCADISFDEGIQIMGDRQVIINKLAAILIMCGAEICRGDVKFWSIYLQWGWKLLRDNGGIMNFNNNKEEHWLISNFAYHDLLASSASDRGTYFSNETYYRIFEDSEGRSSGNLNPLLGVSKPLYKMIGDISSLCFESKQIMKQYYKVSCSTSRSEESIHSPDETGSLYSFSDIDTEVSDHSRVADMLDSINSKAHELELSLNNAKPDSSDLMSLSDSELELQLTTFETFQLSCKLYLRQTILRLNPSALECQILVNDLTKCIDVLIGSPMQATIVFPLFIAGLFTVTESGKTAMRGRFEKLIAAYGTWSLVRVKSLIEKIWEENPRGDCVVDWNAMLKDLQWDLNFA